MSGSSLVTPARAYKHAAAYFAMLAGRAVPSGEDYAHAEQALRVFSIKVPTPPTHDTYNAKYGAMSMDKRVANVLFAGEVASECGLGARAVVIDAADLQSATALVNAHLQPQRIVSVNDESSTRVATAMRTRALELGGVTAMPHCTFIDYLRLARRSGLQFDAIFYDICGTIMGHEEKNGTVELRPTADLGYAFKHALRPLESDTDRRVLALTIARRDNRPIIEWDLPSVIAWVRHEANFHGMHASESAAFPYGNMMYMQFTMRRSRPSDMPALQALTAAVNFHFTYDEHSDD